MSIFSTSIHGAIPAGAQLPAMLIRPGTWQPYIQHSYESLTECPCGYLDRFSKHGKRIREAYENAVVSAIQKFTSIRDANPVVRIVVIGSGGLIQEAQWLYKLFSQRIPSPPQNLILHLVDVGYDGRRSAPLFDSFISYAQRIVPQSVTLNIFAWDSCEALQTALRIKNLRPNLVIGMDTEHATGSAIAYQWDVAPGDIDKVLFVKWESKVRSFCFKIYSRQGSDSTLISQQFGASDSDRAGRAIETIGASF